MRAVAGSLIGAASASASQGSSQTVIYIPSDAPRSDFLDDAEVPSTRSQYVAFAASTVLAVTVAGGVRVAITVPVGSVPSARIVTTGAAFMM